MCGAAAVVDSGRRTCYNLYSTVEMLITRGGPAAVDAAARQFSHEAGVICGIVVETSFSSC